MAGAQSLPHPLTVHTAPQVQLPHSSPMSRPCTGIMQWCGVTGQWGTPRLPRDALHSSLSPRLTPQRDQSSARLTASAHCHPGLLVYMCSSFVEKATATPRALLLCPSQPSPGTTLTLMREKTESFTWKEMESLRCVRPFLLILPQLYSFLTDPGSNW